MTTKVTVDAHAGWPVNVKTVDKDAYGQWMEGQTQVVAPNTVQDFYVHDARRLIIEEGARD